MTARERIVALAPAGFALDAAACEALERAYASPPRAYHSLEHVVEVAEQFGEVARDVGWRAPAETYGAVLFHDAVYVAGASDNETRSAELACRTLRGVDLARVTELVLLTARHGHIERDEVDDDAALFLDCDMAILGAPPERFAEYERAIRSEYSHVPDPLFRDGRRAFLERLRAAHHVFLSAYFRDRLEHRARANIERALLTLGELSADNAP